MFPASGFGTGFDTSSPDPKSGTQLPHHSLHDLFDRFGWQDKRLIQIGDLRDQRIDFALSAGDGVALFLGKGNASGAQVPAS